MDERQSNPASGRVAKIPRIWLICGWGVLSAMTLIPFVRHSFRDVGSESRCALDGLPIADHQRIRVQEDAGQSRHFCSLRCAELWVAKHGTKPLAIYVTDEATGESIEIGEAIVVRSRLLVHEGTKNYQHVFKNIEDAQHHIDAYNGRILTGENRPFPDFHFRP